MGKPACFAYLRFHMPRDRVSGGIDALAALLADAALKPGWFQYEEDLKTATVNSKTLEKHGAVFVKLREAQENLAFSQKELAAALKKIAASKAWPLTTKEFDELAAVTARRLRCACRHVSQALGRSSWPKWLENIFGEKPADDEGEDDEGCNAEEGEEEEAEVDIEEADPEWPYCGYDQELQVAWRSTEQGPKAKREVSSIIVEPPDATDDMAMQAVFGTIHYELADLLVRDWRAKKAVDDEVPLKDKKLQLWRKVHDASGLDMVIRTRNDRQPLVSLFLGTQQVCQVPRGCFETLQHAVDLLAALMQCTWWCTACISSPHGLRFQHTCVWRHFRRSLVRWSTELASCQQIA